MVSYIRYSQTLIIGSEYADFCFCSVCLCVFSSTKLTVQVDIIKCCLSSFCLSVCLTINFSLFQHLFNFNQTYPPPPEQNIYPQTPPGESYGYLYNNRIFTKGKYILSFKGEIYPDVKRINRKNT